MGRKLLGYLFYGNFYIGVLAILLSIETAYQLNIPLCPVSYYLLLFAMTAGYYTYAYSWLPQQYNSDNPRAKWYLTHQRVTNIVLILYIIIACASVFFLLWKYSFQLFQIDILYWIILAVMLLAGFFYYGILPRSYLNLRNTGWLKAFTIGFTWACCVSFMPVFIANWIHHIHPSKISMLWLFLKNFMFCSVNAIMFDIKDYEDDTNRQLKTFVVRVGIQKTIYRILIPLVVMGLLCFCLFADAMDFPNFTFICNLLPFLLMFFVVITLNKAKTLLYYLIVIDGILIFKAICGIAGAWINK